MKQILTSCMLVLLMACAGEPPKWWNPTDKYNVTTQEVQAPKEQAVVKPAPIPQKQEITDELIDVEDTALEEVEFQPLEDKPLPEESAAEQENNAQSAEVTPQDGALMPSILAEEDPIIQDKQPEIPDDTDSDE